MHGAVRTHKVLSDGRRQITGFHLPGDLFGFEPGEAHRHGAEALSGTRVLIFKRRQVERIATRRAEVACQLWSLATRSLRQAQDHMLLLGRRSAQERVAAFLLDVDLRLGGTGTFDLPMTRRDIADYLGLTIETVSRTITQLEAEGHSCVPWAHSQPAPWPDAPARRGLSSKARTHSNREGRSS